MAGKARHRSPARRRFWNAGVLGTVRLRSEGSTRSPAPLNDGNGCALKTSVLRYSRAASSSRRCRSSSRRRFSSWGHERRHWA